MPRKAYQSDISDASWRIIEPLVSREQCIALPREVDLREIESGIFYVLHEGCTWRALPHDLPPWQTVYNYFRHWQRLGVWQEIHTQLRTQVRVRMNKTNTPTAGIIDSQSRTTREKRGASALGGCADLKQLAWKFTATTAANTLKDAFALSSLIP